MDFVFVDEIESMSLAVGVVLKENAEWKKINMIEKPVYRSEIKQNDAGPTDEKTVSSKTDFTVLDDVLIEKIAFHVILRMVADDHTFYVGSPDYPCTVERTSDEVEVSLSFKSVSPTY
jgi:hypothetical protein